MVDKKKPKGRPKGSTTWKDATGKPENKKPVSVKMTPTAYEWFKNNKFKFEKMVRENTD